MLAHNVRRVYVVRMPTAVSEHITTTQVAERLSLTRRQVIRLVDSGQLSAASQLPGRTGAYLFDPADVEALAVERTARAAS